jgi:hypothetical protein
MLPSVDGSTEVLDENVEILLAGDDCRDDGIAQKECRLDCCLDWLLDGREDMGSCDGNAEGGMDSTSGFRCAEKRIERVCSVDVVSAS